MKRCFSLFLGLLLASMGLAQTQDSSVSVTIEVSKTLAVLGEAVECLFTVKNTGKLRISDLKLVASLNGGPEQIVPLKKTELNSNETTSGTWTFTIVKANLPGPLRIVATVTAKDENGLKVMANAYAILYIAAVQLTKEVNPTSAEAGEKIVYTYTVRNVGSVNLKLTKIEDDKLGVIDLQEEEIIGPTEGISITKEWKIPENATGTIVNTATVYASPEKLPSIECTDTAKAQVKIKQPSLKLEKTATPTSAKPGQTVTYTYTIVNDGDFDITDLTLEDDKLGPIPLLDNNNNKIQSIPVGKTITATATHVVTEEDLPGPLTNTAIVKGIPQGTKKSQIIQATSQASVNLMPLGLDNVKLEKTVEPIEAYPKEKVTFTIKVTNGDTVDRTFILIDELLNLREELKLKAGETWSKSFSYTIPAQAISDVENVVTLKTKYGNKELKSTVKVKVLKSPDLPYDPDDPRNQPWNVALAMVKVFDTQVFDGKNCNMRFLDSNYKPVTELPITGSLYLEVTDPDQNEDPLLRELILGTWNKDADANDNALDNPNSEHSYPIWPRSRSDSADRLTPRAGTNLKAKSISDLQGTAKIFVWNVQKGTWEALSLRETGPNTGVFRSTTCVSLAALQASPGDTLLALYQDPSNHSDVAIAMLKVSEGGAGETVPPTMPRVALDKSQYTPGSTVTITVTDPAYAQAPAIRGPKVLTLSLDGTTLNVWNEIPSVGNGTFQVRFNLPSALPLGTLTALYKDPADARRVAQAQAQVIKAALTTVKGIDVAPNPFSTTTTFTVITEPAEAVVDALTIRIYDLTGHKVAELSGEKVTQLTFAGGSLGNGAYIYVAVVVGAGKTWTFKGFVYVER